MLRTTVAMMGFALALCACGDDGGVVAEDDAGGGVVDSGTRVDSSTPRRDGGPTDECAASSSNADSTVGCNGGFVSGEAAANAPGGTCTPGGEGMPAGTCTTPNTLCNPPDGTEGECVAFCDPASTYVSSGECPTGFRCFTLGDAGEEFGVCFRDCDATHACPAGMECDGEGSCVGGEEPEVDGGVMDAGAEDAGVADAGVADAGVDAAVPAK